MARKTLAQAQKDYAYIRELFSDRESWDAAEIYELAYRHVFNLEPQTDGALDIVLRGISHHITRADAYKEPELETDETLKAIVKRWK